MLFSRIISVIYQKLYLLRLVGLFTVFTMSPAQAEEYLLQENFPDYQILREIDEVEATVVEWIPQAQSATDWKNRLSTAILYAQQGQSIADYFASRQKIWRTICPQSEAKLVTEGMENGFPFMLWSFYCARQAETDSPEYAWVKGIQGEQALYVVQKTFRYPPQREEVLQWINYLKGVVVVIQDEKTE